MRSCNYIFAFLLLLLPLPALSVQDVSFPASALSIKTQDRTLHFTVEVATTPQQQQHGLMFRKSLPDMHGMIFIFPTPRKVIFWMKNTPLPLDMLFVDSKGIVTQIVENAQPESTDLIRSLKEARAVVELKGGAAGQYHIAPGNKIIYSIFP